MFESKALSSSKIGLIGLIISAIATIILWQFPWGNYILYPCSILATWFHEMGHGLTAILLGGSFHKLLIFSNGSGIAYNAVSENLRAFVAMGGPLGPAIAGGLLILSSRRHKTAHWCLAALGAVILLSVLLWIRTWFGAIALSLWGLFILLIAFETPKQIQGWMVQFLGVQAIISTYHQKEYLFGSNSVNINGEALISDTAKISQYLFFPHWFWAALIMIISTCIFWISLNLTYGSDD